MAKKNDRQMFLVRGQIIFILYNDNTYVVVHCKNILQSFRWNFYVKMKMSGRQERHQAGQSYCCRPPSNA